MDRRIAGYLHHTVRALMLGLLLLLAAAPRLLAAPPLPSSFYGNARLNGANVPSGTLVSAWVNETKIAEAPVTLVNGVSVYRLDVLGDDMETAGLVEGGVTNDTVLFQVAGFPAASNATWQNGTYAKVDLNGTPPPQPPVAQPQSVSTNEDTPLDILISATDINGDPLTYTVVTPPQHGILSGTAPALRYTPNADFHGSDSFAFRANDGTANSNQATVSITVNPVVDPPRLDIAIATAAVEEGATSTITFSAVDADGDPVTFSVNGLPAFVTFTDHGDGSGTLSIAPGYDDAGVYAGIEIIATDGVYSDREFIVIRVDNVIPRPHASFTVDKEMDVTEPVGGALLHSASGQVNATNGASNLLDNNAATYWAAPKNATPQWAIIDLAGGSLQAIDRVRVQSRTGSPNSEQVKDFEVWVSETTTDTAAFVKVLTATALQNSSAQEFVLPGGAASTRYVKYVPLTNYGASCCISTAAFQALTRPRDGGIVSLYDGPAATIAALSSTQNGTNESPQGLIDANATTSWRSAQNQTTNQWVTVDLGGPRLYTLNRIRLQNPSGAQATQGVKDFEIRVSTTTTDTAAFTTVFAGTAAQNNTLQEFSFSPIRARHVQLFMKNSHGSTTNLRVNSFQALTPIGINAARLEGVGAVVAARSSEFNASRSAENVIDYNSTTFWTTGSGQVTNQWIKILLMDGAPFTIDRVLLQGNTTFESPRDFSIRVSTTTADDAAFTTVYQGTLPRNTQNYWFGFAPVKATYVQLLIHNNHGNGSTITLNNFQVYSPDLGGAVVPFVDRSTTPVGEVTAWAWDFGDGQTSTERNPRHAYAAPGTYPVRLTVTNAQGISDTTTISYTVLRPPAADFVWTPAIPNEGQQTTLANATDTDGVVVAANWRFAHTTNTATGLNTTTTFPDNGSYWVALSVIDSQLLSGVTTKTVTVANVAPTLDIGPDVIIRRTGETFTIPGGETFRNYNDASAIDRAALQFLWEAGDGRTFTTSSLNLSYSQPGTYIVRLTITDPQGATAIDQMQVRVYDDAIAPTPSIQLIGSQNKALPETSRIPSLRALGAAIHSYSAEFNSSVSVQSLLDFNSDSRWATIDRNTNKHWAIIALAGGKTYQVDRILLQPSQFNGERVKDFEVWVSSTTTDDAAFVKVLAAAAADNNSIQAFVLPGGPVAAKYVKYVPLNSRQIGGEVISTASFHVVTTDDLGPGGVVAASSQRNEGNRPELLLDSEGRSWWVSAQGQTSNQWAKILLAGGQTWPIHGVAINPGFNPEAMRAFEIWVSTTSADDAAFTRVYTGTTINNDTLQTFLFPEVAAKYVKLVALSNWGNSCCIAVGTLQVLTSVPALDDGWYDGDVLVTMAAEDNAGGSGVNLIQYSTNNGANWTSYNGPYIYNTVGSNPLWVRATDVARNISAPLQSYVLVDKTRKRTRQEAGQAGIDWLSTSAINESTTLGCVACHVQGEALHGLALTKSTGYAVDTSANSELDRLVDFLTSPQYQRSIDGLWGRPNASGLASLNTNTGHSLFGLAMYDRYVSTDKSANLVKAATSMMGRQASDGRWAIEETEPPTNQGDIQPTVHMIFALRQAIQRVDATLAAQFQTSLDRALAWLRSAPISGFNQDKALKLVGLIEGGVVKDDPLVVQLRDAILAEQLADGGWREDTSRAWTSSFATGQSLYALCRAGVSRFHPQVVKGIDWLIHSQGGHSTNNIVPYSLLDGPWMLQYTGARQPFASTMWPVIALGCFGELGLTLTPLPEQHSLQANLAVSQTVTYTLLLENTGVEDDIYDLVVSGGPPGWTATSPPSIAISAGLSQTALLSVMTPPSLSENMIALFGVTATSRKSAAVSRAVTVSAATSPPPSGGHATQTTLTAGNAVSTTVDLPIQLAATVRDLVDNVQITGPGSGVVNFMVVGIVVGSDGDADGDGSFEIEWIPGLAWGALGAQDVRALYSGMNRPDPLADRQASFASGLLTLGPSTRPIAQSQTVTALMNEALPITLTASDPKGLPLSFSVSTPPSHGSLSGSAPSLVYTPAPAFSGVDHFTFQASNGSSQSQVATVSIQVVAPDLVLSKSDGKAAVTPGELLTYTLTITNAGPVATANTRLTDTLPLHTAYVAASHGAAHNAGVVTWPLFNLPADATITRTVTAQVAGTIEAGVHIMTNTAIVLDERGVDLHLADNTAQDVDVIEAVPDLRLSKDNGLTVVRAGDVVTYTLTISNAGHQHATGVLVRDILPTHSTFVRASHNGSEDIGVVTWPIFALPAGESMTRTLTLRVGRVLPADEDTITNSATVADDAVNGADPDLADNGAEDADSIDKRPDLAVAKSDGQSLVDAGATVTYTITISNVSPYRAGQVAVTDTLPAHTTFVAASHGGTHADGEVAWPAFVLAADEQVSRTVTVQVASALPADVKAITNSVTVEELAFQGSDFNHQDNTAFDVTHLRAAPVVQLVKEDGGITGSPGSAITYTLRFSNTGHQDATGVLITETVPAHTTFLAAASHPAWNCAGSGTAGSTCIYTISALAAGSRGTISFTVVVDPQVPEGVLTINNVALIGDNSPTGGVDPAQAGRLASSNTPLNLAPLAADDEATTDEDVAVDVRVMSNDSDLNGDALSVTEVGIAGNGRAVISGTSTIVYTPTANFHGVASFNYSISDGQGGTDTATVQVTVKSINDAPVAEDGSYQLDEDASVDIALTVLDVDGDDLSFRLIDQPVHGALGGTPPALTYTPASGFIGADSFTYQVDDGVADSNVATVSLTVIATKPDLVLVKSNGQDVVQAGEHITYTLTITNMSSVDAVAIALKDTLPVHTAFVGASDGGSESGGVVQWPAFDLAAGATVSRTAIARLNSNLPAAVEQITNRATVLDGRGIERNLGNNDAEDTDAVGATPRLLIGKSDSGIEVHSGERITYTLSYSNTGSREATGVVISETVPAHTTFVATASHPAWLCANGGGPGATCTLAVGSLVASSTGILSFTVAVHPQVGSNVSAIENVVVISHDKIDPAHTSDTVKESTPVLQPPLAVADTFTVAEDSQPTPLDVLANDTAPAIDVVSIVRVDAASHGTVVVEGAKLVYTPATNFHGADQFAYTIRARGLTSTALVAVEVMPVSDKPDALNDTATTPEDTAVRVAVLDNDRDVDNDTLALSAAGAPAHGTTRLEGLTIEYTPAANYHGADSFSYVVTDGEFTDTASVVLTVTPVNDAPMATNDQATTPMNTPITLHVLSNDTDVDKDTLTIQSLGSVAHGTVVIANNQIVYTPAAGYHGSDSFTYVVSDGNLTATAKVTVNITPVAGNECKLYPIALYKHSLNQHPMCGGLITVSGGTQPGNFGWLSWEGSTRTPSLVASLTPPGTSHLYVNPNDASDTSLSSGDWIRGLPGVKNANEVRQVLDRLKTMDIIVPVWDMAKNQGSNAQYRVSGYARVRIVKYDLSGKGGLTLRYLGAAVCESTHMMALSAQAALGPSAEEDAYITEPGVAVSADTLANDLDLAGGGLALALVESPKHGMVSIEGNNTFLYQPDEGFAGLDEFSYQVTDANGATDWARIVIAVENEPGGAGSPQLQSYLPDVSVDRPVQSIVGEPIESTPQLFLPMMGSR